MANQTGFHIRQAAVLGAGVMGAQIAAHLSNAGIPTLLYELPADGGDSDAHVKKAIAGLAKLKPAPLAEKALAKNIVPSNYEDDLASLADCDLIIEAIAERMEWKHDLYNKVSPHINKRAILASNTSGLGIGRLSQVLPESLRSRFCGLHFFNPPRYMHLVELIPTQETDTEVLSNLETFLTTALGKGVVYAKDTPNFIGNRIGVFSMLSTIHHAEQFKLGFDTVDALTGAAIGRPKSATFRTADVVGLDTFSHVVSTMAETLHDDPWRDYFKCPKWMHGLIENGALGQKTRVGIYKKEGRKILVLDPESGAYRASDSSIDAEVAAILKIKDGSQRLAALRGCAHDQAQFLWAIQRDLFHYCACVLEEIADNARDLDFAIRWGYGWKNGPFEAWQAGGWQQVAGWISEDIAADKTMADSPLPAWVLEKSRSGVHSADGSYSPARGGPVPRPQLPVYRRQLFPDALLGETAEYGETIFETPEVRLWHQGDEVAVLSFKTKMHTIPEAVLDGVQRAVEVAEERYRGLVLWQTREPFSAGADLSSAVESLQTGGIEAFDAMVAKFQATSMKLKYAQVPTVAAVRGLALGGGCEFTMHCSCAVAALESYIGLVEVGVGLLPAGGGLKEFAARVPALAGPGDPFPWLQKIFQTVAMGTVATSAVEAQQLGYLRHDDVVVFNAYELLHVAKQQALALSETGYRPPPPQNRIEVAGKTGIANLKLMLVNMLEGHFISPHDYEIGSRIAEVLCGGQVEGGSLVDENWLLRLEREHFVALAQMPKTQERVMHMLKTGKPLRN